jgi:hypothetical protein
LSVKVVGFFRIGMQDKLLGGGQRDAGLDGSGRSVNELAILPRQTHYTMSAAPALVTAVVPFLDAGSAG